MKLVKTLAILGGTALILASTAASPIATGTALLAVGLFSGYRVTCAKSEFPEGAYPQGDPFTNCHPPSGVLTATQSSQINIQSDYARYEARLIDGNVTCPTQLTIYPRDNARYAPRFGFLISAFPSAEQFCNISERVQEWCVEYFLEDEPSPEPTPSPTPKVADKSLGPSILVGATTGLGVSSIGVCAVAAMTAVACKKKKRIEAQARVRAEAQKPHDPQELIDHNLGLAEIERQV